MAPLVLVPRPWLELYGVHIRVRTVKREVQVELAPIQKALPDELLVAVFGCLPPYLLGKVACVCSQFQELAGSPRLWQRACQEAFQTAVQEPLVMASLLKTSYMGSWRRMFLERPHLRFDGLYVSRNTYVKTGVVEWATRNAVHLVTYYRYYRFFADGSFLYRTTPLPVSKAARTLLHRPRAAGAARNKWSEEQVYSGRYLLKGTKLYCVVVYDNCRSTEIRSVMKLRSTRPGTNDRLDIERIFSYDRDSRAESNLVAAPVDPEGTDVVAGASREHRRGTACCVHVPWEQVATTPLNLSGVQMDYYMPG